MPSNKEYNQLLQYLYFEGYSDSYAEAEELLESMSDEEFEELAEEVFYEEKNDSYLETNMEKRKKNNEKAIEDMKKTDAHTDMVATVRNKFNEEVDIFDYLLEYLIAEGYADTNDSAIAIMANMSEEWKEEILDEANKGETHSNTPNWDKVYDRNTRDYGPNQTKTHRGRAKSGELETANQTTKRLGKERVQAHKDTRGMKKKRGSKGVWFSSGRM